MRKRILTAVMITAMLAAMSCSSDKAAVKETTAAENIETTTEVTTEPRIDPGLPEEDLGGYNFRVLTKGTTNVHWKSFDIAAEEQNGEPINDAVFLRNSKVGEKYNFTVEDVPVKDYAAMATEATNVVLAGDNSYDMFALHVNSLINNNYLYNLYDVPYMDLEQPYYDQNIIESLSLGGKLFAVTGELMIMDNQATLGVTFNKKIAEDYGFAEKYGTDLYGLVNDGRFTLDVFHETAAIAASDLNGDGQMTDLEDQWGFQTETGNYALMFYGSGSRTVTLNSEGYPELVLGSDRDIAVVEKIYDIQNSDYAFNVSLVSSNYADVWSECADKNFIEGRVLYSIAGLNRVTLFRTMDIDFGIIPLPKYDEAQDDYFSPVSTGCANFISFPATMVEAERNGLIVEALSCESLYTLTPAFYDVTLTGKAVRDEESLEMLDIIFNNRVWDLGYYFNWGGIQGIFQNASTFSSQLASLEASINSAIDTTMNVILGK